MNFHPEEMEDFSPEKVAQSVFNFQPTNPCAYQIITTQDGQDITYVFEILITILMEGLDILTNGLNNANLSNFNEEHISIMDPWFNSLGFNIFVTKFDEKDKELFKDYYCKIVIRTSYEETFFVMKQINKNYHFILNGNFQQNKKNLKELKCIFFINKNVYLINFDFYKLIYV
ncbi:Hypothetical protein KVN_LOCUS429 [uncultured virus]|nr:Hypothetical protein KVN_LOCUS429 [uncultured virus]